MNSVRLTHKQIEILIKDYCTLTYQANDIRMYFIDQGANEFICMVNFSGGRNLSFDTNDVKQMVINKLDIDAESMKFNKDKNSNSPHYALEIINPTKRNSLQR